MSRLIRVWNWVGLLASKERPKGKVWRGSSDCGRGIEEGAGQEQKKQHKRGPLLPKVGFQLSIFAGEISLTLGPSLEI
jgi:hypothetical protein